MGAPSDQFHRIVYGGLLLSVSLLTIGGTPQVNFFVYYKCVYGAPSGQFLRLLCGGPLRSVSSLTIRGPLRSVSSHTIWGLPQTCFCILYGTPSDQFLRFVYRAPRQFFYTLNYRLGGGAYF